jgi:hypothetical protein
LKQRYISLHTRKNNLYLQKHIFEQNYKDLTEPGYPTLDRQKLVWRGRFTPIADKTTYVVEIRHRRDRIFPQVFLISPPLAKRDNVFPEHLIDAKKGQLCVFHRSNWNSQKTISATNLLGWISKWLLTYEIWQVTGNWNADYVEHSF